MTVIITDPNGVSSTTTQTNVTLNQGDNKWNIGGGLLQTYGLRNACSYHTPSEIEWDFGDSGLGLSATPAGGVHPMGVFPTDYDGASRSEEPMWVTVKEDITGSTWYDDLNYSSYPYKSGLLSPDFKVDVKDVAAASKAFGSYPGHSKWSAIADINNDYKIDVKDIAAIAKKFGWVGHT